MGLPDFELKHVQSVNFEFYSNRLCLDLRSEIEDYIVSITQDMSLVECYKNLVDCFWDFGQFAYNDNAENTDKPFGPFSKIVDECSIGLNS